MRLQYELLVYSNRWFKCHIKVISLNLVLPVDDLQVAFAVSLLHEETSKGSGVRILPSPIPA